MLYQITVTSHFNMPLTASAMSHRLRLVSPPPSYPPPLSTCNLSTLSSTTPPVLSLLCRHMYHLAYMRLVNFPLPSSPLHPRLSSTVIPPGYCLSSMPCLRCVFYCTLSSSPSLRIMYHRPPPVSSTGDVAVPSSIISLPVIDCLQLQASQKSVQGGRMSIRFRTTICGAESFSTSGLPGPRVSRVMPRLCEICSGY